MTARPALLWVVLLASLLGVAPLFASDQPRATMTHIGVLGATSASAYAPYVEAFRQGLRDLGYIEGKNIQIEYRWAHGKYERLPELAAELARLKVALIVTHGTPGTQAAKGATTTIPIVMAVAGDAVATGLIAGIVHPGGNVTGSSFFFPELVAKRLELLKEAVPRVSRMGVLLNPANPANRPVIQALDPAATFLKVELQHVEVRAPEELDTAFATLIKRRVEAVAIVDDALIITQARRIAELARRNRLPTIGFREYAEADGLMAYAVHFPDLWRRAALFADRILKGAKPADLPVEQPNKFELVINLKAAKALGLTIPQSLLLRADEVLE
jgi:putative tryptophan/tyrosine transport system substrate-binding protein